MAIIYPRYKNNTVSTITPRGSANTYAAGQAYTENEYLKVPAGLTLITHLEEGFAGAEVYDSTLPSGDLTVVGYDYIYVYNGTDAVIEIAANGDTGARKVPAGGLLELMNVDPRWFHTLSITGTGAGNVQVWGEV